MFDVCLCDLYAPDSQNFTGTYMAVAGGTQNQKLAAAEQKHPPYGCAKIKVEERSGYLYDRTHIAAGLCKGA